jgi:hypothetical protein
MTAIDKGFDAYVGRCPGHIQGDQAASWISAYATGCRHCLGLRDLDRGNFQDNARREPATFTGPWTWLEAKLGGQIAHAYQE